MAWVMRRLEAPSCLAWAALVRPTSLVQRFLEPEEVANLVAFLASPLSSATNGAAVRADGGVLPTPL
ncbi:SDR family oxidoreductase [Galactobacter caseinivorans]|uniref:SDR family NAD(P)-dependent oxidoreductase n=1 Tax=Galactobacter caseinivorans TaxID=2676123 RepID=A0A496PFU1_9MICC|nr:SDR family NAD(P)-dependent oxidoreductase [Galactobacter caseinivorans]